ncbi:putative polysaccharide biosynthesis protein [Aphelenchoides avenae]|nr:putative polysaccharide biosynthesis protein [Aphelenchus avenae]
MEDRPERAVRVSLYYKDGPVQDVTLSSGKISIIDASGLRILSDLPLEGTSYTKGSGWSQCLYAESGKMDKFSEYIRNNVGAQITVVAELSIARTWFQPMKYLPATSGVSKEVEETCQQVLSEILHDELVLPNVEKLLAMENKYEVHKHIFDFALTQVSKRCGLVIQLEKDLIERVVSNVYFDSVLNETATCFEDYLEILQWLGHDYRYLKAACERFICREVLMESADTAFVKKMLLLAERYSLSVLKMVSFGVLVDRLTSPLKRRESIPEIRSDLLQMAEHVTSSIANDDAVAGNSEESEILVGAVVAQLEQLVKHIRKVSMEEEDKAIGPAPIPIIPNANRRSSLKTSRDLLQFSSQLTSASERNSTDDDEDTRPTMADLATQLHDDPNNYINDPNVEIAWAMKAAERASVHMNLIMATDTRALKLTKHQEEMHKQFREAFPSMDVEEVTEIQLKGDNKEKWRLFCEQFRELVDDYNLGTMLRIRADGAYTEENTIIVPKTIHLAIEAARNIEGVNERLKAKYSEAHKQAHDAGGNVI